MKSTKIRTPRLIMISQYVTICQCSVEMSHKTDLTVPYKFCKLRILLYSVKLQINEPSLYPTVICWGSLFKQYNVS